MNRLFFLLYFVIPIFICSHVQAWFDFGSVRAFRAYQNKDYQQSLHDLEDGLNKDPYDVEHNYNIGVVFYKQKKYQDALQAFLRAGNCQNKSSVFQQQTYFNTANCYFQLEQWRDAVEQYQKVLALDADHVSAEHNLRLALYKLKEEEMKQKVKEQDQKSDNHDQSSADQNNQEDVSQKSCSGSGQEAKNHEGSGSQEQGQEQSGQSSKNKNTKNNQKASSGSNGSDPFENNSFKQQGGQKDDASIDTASQQKTDGHDTQDHGQDLQSKIPDNQSMNNAAQDQDHVNQGGDNDHDGLDQSMLDEKNGTAQKLFKQPALQNEMQEQYESKTFEDERLNEYHASLIKTLEELEKKIQKHVIKNKVAMQGAGQNGKKGW